MTSPARTSRSEAITPVVENGGFTLVEEDDVAFSISLCREIHRIYGSYESGDLEADHSVHLGLSLSVQILTTLANTVTKGMPAMRIEVASAQSREMMAVLFGEPLFPQKGRAGRRQLEGRCTRPLGPAQEASGLKAIPPPELAPAGLLTALTAQHRSGDVTGAASSNPNPLQPSPAQPSSPERSSFEPASPDSIRSAAPVSDPSGPAAPPARSAHPKRLSRWFGARPLVIRILLGILGCGLAAVLIDVPIVILLLFFNLFVPISVGYLAVAAAARWAYRRHQRRTTGHEVRVLSNNPLSWLAWNAKASPTCAAR